MRQVADNSGIVTSRYNYDGYGVAQSTSSSSAEYAVDHNVTSLLYSGKQYDSTLGMYNLRARYYNPANGTFNQRDTFKGDNFDPQSLHKYTYANCDPVNRIDPSGLASLGEILVVSGIIGIIAAGVTAAIFHATGGNAIRGAVVGFVAGFSFTFAAFESKFFLACVLAFWQGFGTAAVSGLASFALGHALSFGALFQKFLEGFAFGQQMPLNERAFIPPGVTIPAGVTNYKAIRSFVAEKTSRRGGASQQATSS